MKEEAKGVKELAEAIKGADRIILLTGAGISVSAGIPDFRSEGSGLYYNLQKYDLPHPTAIFQIDYFKSRPCPFYGLQKDLFPSHLYFPTLTHAFIRYLQDCSKLALNVTQNIDGLDQRSGITELMAAHGSFSLPALCLTCGHEYPALTAKAAAFDEAIPVCECGGLIKPQIVFFGEEVRVDEDRLLESCKAGLCLVIGTSLQVGPVNQIPFLCKCPKALINNEKVGTGIKWDYLAIGDCDEEITELCKEMGCYEDVEKVYKEIKNNVNDMEDCLVKNNSELQLIAVAGDLIIPSARQVEHQHCRIIFALSSTEQVTLLKQMECKTTEIDIEEAELPPEFSKYYKKEISLFSLEKNSGYYRPFNGHYSSYITEFIEYTVDGQDIWDIITREPGTMYNDQIITENYQGKCQKINTNAIELIFMKENVEEIEEENLEHLLKTKLKRSITKVGNSKPHELNNFQVAENEDFF